jgi:hypothetical protein
MSKKESNHIAILSVLCLKRDWCQIEDYFTSYCLILERTEGLDAGDSDCSGDHRIYSRICRRGEFNNFAGGQIGRSS